MLNADEDNLIKNQFQTKVQVLVARFLSGKTSARFLQFKLHSRQKNQQVKLFVVIIIITLSQEAFTSRIYACQIAARHLGLQKQQSIL